MQKSLWEEHAHFYTDGNNEAITNNSPYLCKSCYENKYHVKLKNDVQRFRENLIDKLYNLKKYHHIESVDINKVIEYIKNF